MRETHQNRSYVATKKDACKKSARTGQKHPPPDLLGGKEGRVRGGNHAWGVQKKKAKFRRRGQEVGLHASRSKKKSIP